MLHEDEDSKGVTGVRELMLLLNTLDVESVKKFKTDWINNVKREIGNNDSVCEFINSVCDYVLQHKK